MKTNTEEELTINDILGLSDVHVFESVLAEQVMVEYRVSAYDGDQNKNNYSAAIQIQGRSSTQVSEATSAHILFYPDGDNRIIKPYFDLRMRRIYISLPLSHLQNNLDIINSSNKAYCVYYRSSTAATHNGFLRGYNGYKKV